MLTRVIIAAGLLGTFAPAAPAQGEVGDPSRYYFILFGGQGEPFRARTAHTWAVYAKATPMVTGEIGVESFAISWLPATGVVHPYRFRPEPGRNWSLPDTLAIMGRANSLISMWGPYEITPAHFAMGEEHLRFLNSGQVRFRSIDSFNLNKVTVNCVHAVTHSSPMTTQYIQPVIRVGEPGTSRLAKLYLRGGAWPRYPATADWLIPVLGLDAYPKLTQREPGERIPRRLR
jgi:hypothetical protein